MPTNIFQMMFRALFPSRRNAHDDRLVRDAEASQARDVAERKLEDSEAQVEATRGLFAQRFREIFRRD